jgi:hypothetical protein
VARVVNAGASLQPSLDGVVHFKMYSYGPTVTDMSLQGLYQFITIDMGLFSASVAFIYILNLKLVHSLDLWSFGSMFGAVWGRAACPISYNSPLGGLEGVEQELFWEEFKHPSSLLG